MKDELKTGDTMVAVSVTHLNELIEAVKLLIEGSTGPLLQTAMVHYLTLLRDNHPSEYQEMLSKAWLWDEENREYLLKALREMNSTT